MFPLGRIALLVALILGGTSLCVWRYAEASQPAAPPQPAFPQHTAVLAAPGAASGEASEETSASGEAGELFCCGGSEESAEPVAGTPKAEADA